MSLSVFLVLSCSVMAFLTTRRILNPRILQTLPGLSWSQESLNPKPAKEMADHMRHVVEAGGELTPEEGQMLSVAYKNKAGGFWQMEEVFGVYIGQPAVF